MQVDFTPEQEAQLSEAAMVNGKGVEELVREVALRFIAQQDAEFLAAVDEGLAEADRGDMIDHQEVWVSLLKDRASFREGVRRGIEAADRGDFTETTELSAD